MIISEIAKGIVQPLFGTIDKFIEDKDLAAKLKSELEAQALANAKSEMEAKRDILVAEISGESEAQRNWRPHLMYLIMGLFVFNGVAVPILAAFGYTLPTLEAWNAIPGELWDVLMVGLGGYIGGRTLEKVARVVAPTISRKVRKEDITWNE